MKFGHRYTELKGLQDRGHDVAGDHGFTERPELPDNLEIIVGAYQCLNNSRPDDLRTLAPSEVLAYLQLIPYPDTDFFIELIFFIDRLMTNKKLIKHNELVDEHNRKIRNV